jgi:hypothetical protein
MLPKWFSNMHQHKFMIFDYFNTFYALLKIRLVQTIKIRVFKARGLNFSEYFSEETVKFKKNWTSETKQIFVYFSVLYAQETVNGF